MAYICQNCAGRWSKWSGQCPTCAAWNTLNEEAVLRPGKTNASPYLKLATPSLTNLATISNAGAELRLSSGLLELDLVLGGGLVIGSVILLGGDPGIGKSTLVLQVLAHLSKQHKVIYVSGEESLAQVTLRAQRLNLAAMPMLLLAHNNVEQILQLVAKEQPQVVIIDSIQTMYTELLAATPGSVSQVRESAAQLSVFAKQHNITLWLIGHVTKEGTLAGPRVLEHMVDTVLYFENAMTDNRYRIVRAVKNRFGPANEIGVFAMTAKGLRALNNPSAIFLSRHAGEIAGSVTMAAKEGSRPLLIEVQALAAPSNSPSPRRLGVGLDTQRLMMLLAILHRHGGIVSHNYDIFVNIVGGIQVNEPAADAAILLAIASSVQNIPVPTDLVVFGEVGLAGELRPIHSGQERLREARKHGFKQALIPVANAPPEELQDFKIYAATSITTLLEYFNKQVL
jgi:DNA repair protein RadA/Sms